jgi:Recombination endonuclease VII
MAKRRAHPRPNCTPDERQALYDLQGGQCAICRADDQELHLDHSYRTGRTRELLWRQCNCVLGMLRDSPKKLRAALQYLLKPPAQALQCM